ncbi:MAG: peptidylprolyl isomerase [Legionella sp.]|nr:MAG: peptidylprolyl isomerase [Legionella sp.]
MLQKLNERIQGVVAWVVIILIAITFTLFGVDYYLQSHHTSDAKAVVNDHPITNQAFEVSYRRSRAQQDLSQMTAEDEKKLQSQVLEQMIANEVTVQAARKYGFEVTSGQANNAIVNIPQFQEDGHFSKERYKHALSGALFTPDSFQNEVRQGMLLNQQRFAFMSSSFALSDELKRFVKLYMQNRDYDYMTISSARFEKQIKVSPEQIQAYYEKHKSEFMSQEQVSLDYVVLSMPDIRSKIKITPEESKRYYDENQGNYLTPAQWKVAHILFAVPEGSSIADEEQIQNKANSAYAILEKNPEQFTELVKSSDDKLSIPKKGILPWMSVGQNEYDKILTNLTKPGQISTPQKTSLGYEIFKVIDYKPVTTKSYKEVQTMIEEQLTVEKAQAEYTQSMEQLTDLSYQTPDTLQPVAEALKLKIQKTQPFARQGGTEEFTKNQLVINAAFSHDVLELSNNSEPIQLNNDSVAVVRLNGHFKSKQQDLNSVLDRIMVLLAKKLADEKAKELGTQLLNPVEDKKQQELIAENQLKWVSVAQATRDNDKENSSINDLAFNLLRPESRDGVILPNGDYVIVRLKRINDGKLSALDKERRDSLLQQIEANYGMMDYDLYVNNLISHAEVARH